MQLNDYQMRAGQAADYSDSQTKLGKLFLSLGLLGEAGELADSAKDLLRGQKSEAELSRAMVKDLGDILWYVSQLATEFGLELDSIAQRNLELLYDMKRIADGSPG